jgi:hypothetical protein
MFKWNPFGYCSGRRGIGHWISPPWVLRLASVEAPGDGFRPQRTSCTAHEISAQMRPWYLRPDRIYGPFLWGPKTWKVGDDRPELYGGWFNSLLWRSHSHMVTCEWPYSIAAPRAGFSWTTLIVILLNACYNYIQRSSSIAQLVKKFHALFRTYRQELATESYPNNTSVVFIQTGTKL